MRTTKFDIICTMLWMLGMIVLSLLIGLPGIARGQIRVECEGIDEPAEHHHHAVAVNGIQVVIIRTGGAGHSLEHRCEHASEHLDEVIQQIQARLRRGETIEGFRVRMQGSDAVVYWADTDIITATSGDVTGYKRRDVPDRDLPITPRLVAEYWRALIEDVVFMFVNSEQPRLMEVYKERNLLQTVYQKGLVLVKQSGTVQKSTELINYFQKALRDISEADRSNIMRHYVRIIPPAFSPSQVMAVTYQQHNLSPPPSSPPSPPPSSPSPPSPSPWQKVIGILLLVIVIIIGSYLAIRQSARMGSNLPLSVTLEQLGDGVQSIQMETFELPPAETIHFARETNAEHVFDVGSAQSLLQNREGKLLFYPNPEAQPKTIRQGDTVLVPLADGSSVGVKVVRVAPIRHKRAAPVEKQEAPFTDDLGKL